MPRPPQPAHQPPRGIRNNNPGNIRHGIQWDGLAAAQPDPGFATFATPQAGIRALALNLVNYQRQNHLTTLAEIIHRWAPPGDHNNTPAYIAAVSREIEVAPNQRLDLQNNPDLLTRLVVAITNHENGPPPRGQGSWFPPDVVDAGVHAALRAHPTGQRATSGRLHPAAPPPGGPAHAQHHVPAPNPQRTPPTRPASREVHGQVLHRTPVLQKETPKLDLTPIHRSAEVHGRVMPQSTELQEMTPILDLTPVSPPTAPDNAAETVQGQVVPKQTPNPDPAPVDLAPAADQPPDENAAADAYGNLIDPGTDSSSEEQDNSGGGQLAARITDMHVCPLVTAMVPHVGGPVAAGSPDVYIAGQPAARVGDMLTCVGGTDVIASGSSTVFINGIPAARVTDKTGHGGTLVAGAPTVLFA